MLRATVAAMLVALTACATASAEIRTPEFKRSAFSSNPIVTNEYDPLTPGTVLYYQGVKEGLPETAHFEITHKRKSILGVNTTVIHDQVFVEGKLHENTTDWYAQDKAGNVWYFGEATEVLNAKGERETSEGSWQAGKRVEGKGAIGKPGIFMPGNPEVGVGYKQEIAPEVSEDQFEVADLNASVTTPFVTTNRALRTKETTPLEPGTIDAKYFVLGIGEAIETTEVGSEDHLELVNVERGR
jgi:hypothetical protein